MAAFRENPYANNFKPWKPAHKLAVVKAAPRNEVEQLAQLRARQERVLRLAFNTFVRDASAANVRPNAAAWRYRRGALAAR